MDKAGRVGAKRTRRLPRTAVRARGKSASTPVVTPVSTPRASALDQLKVLVLEDNADTREALGLFLCEDDGFAMEACGDVAACIDLLREGARGGLPTFDVLLLDLLLLDGHVGTEVIDAARADVTIALPPWWYAPPWRAGLAAELHADPLRVRCPHREQAVQHGRAAGRVARGGRAGATGSEVNGQARARDSPKTSCGLPWD